MAINQLSSVFVPCNISVQVAHMLYNGYSSPNKNPEVVIVIANGCSRVPCEFFIRSYTLESFAECASSHTKAEQLKPSRALGSAEWTIIFELVKGIFIELLYLLNST